MSASNQTPMVCGAGPARPCGAGRGRGGAVRPRSMGLRTVAENGPYPDPAARALGNRQGTAGPAGRDGSPSRPRACAARQRATGIPARDCICQARFRLPTDCGGPGGCHLSPRRRKKLTTKAPRHQEMRDGRGADSRHSSQALPEATFATAGHFLERGLPVRSGCRAQGAAHAPALRQAGLEAPAPGNRAPRNPCLVVVPHPPPTTSQRPAPTATGRQAEYVC